MPYWRLLLLCAAISRAQTPFEIHVYEYEPLPRGTFTYEAHMNYSDRYQFSSEVTAGITDQFRVAAVVLTSDALRYEGFHLLPHFYAPPSWKLPLNLGIVAEFSFERNQPRHVEFRPIVEKHIGRLELDANPVATRIFGREREWIFEPAARIGWRASRIVTPSFEYYGSLSSDPVHQVFPGADLHLGEHVTWSLGAGFGLSQYGSRFIAKSRIEFELGRRHH
jgi:hypothetical protein